MATESRRSSTSVDAEERRRFPSLTLALVVALLMLVPLVYPSLPTLLWPDFRTDTLLILVFAPVMAIEVALAVLSARRLGQQPTRSGRRGWVVVLILASIGTVLAPLYVVGRILLLIQG